MTRYKFLLFLFFLSSALQAQDWYRSNHTGMALEKLSSRMVALHYEWALYTEKAGSNMLPAILRSYFRTSYTIERRLLYERGKLKRQQWLFRDGGGTTRLNASLPADPDSIGKTTNVEIPPFVEIFSSDYSLTETHQHLASGVFITRYSYNMGLLIKAETFLDDTPLWTDSYRYTRRTLLRGVERTYSRAGSYAEPMQGTSSRPPVAPASLDLREAPPVAGFVSPVVPYDNSIMTDVLRSIYTVKTARVIYDTDNQGRVITETRFDEEGGILAEINNEWTNERITMIRWKAGSDQGRIVFRYSGKDRISEEDYRNGVLERRVIVQEDEEIEEIFMNNKIVLRAVWKDGRKQSEERIR